MLGAGGPRAFGFGGRVAGPAGADRRFRIWGPDLHEAGPHEQ